MVVMSRLEKEVKKLISQKILVRCPACIGPLDVDVPDLVTEEKLMFLPPEISLKVR